MSPWWGIPLEGEAQARPTWQKVCPTCGQPLYGYTAYPATPALCVFDVVENAAQALEEN